MSEVTVKQLAEVVNTPVQKLIEQLSEAGLNFNSADQVVSDEQKMQLLDHLRNSRIKSTAETSGEAKKITLRRKSTSQLKVGGTTGRNASGGNTVNVEVRRKRTYVKRSVVLEEAAKEEQKRAEEQAAREKEIAAQLEQAALEKEAKAKQKAEEEALEQSKLEAQEEPVVKLKTPEQEAIEQVVPRRIKSR